MILGERHLPEKGGKDLDGLIPTLFCDQLVVPGEHQQNDELIDYKRISVVLEFLVVD